MVCKELHVQINVEDGTTGNIIPEPHLFACGML